MVFTFSSLAMRAERLNPGLVEFDLTATTEDCVWDAQVKLINRAYNENWRSLFAVQVGPLLILL